MRGRSPILRCRGHSAKLYSRKASSQNELEEEKKECMTRTGDGTHEDRIAHTAKGGSRISVAEDSKEDCALTAFSCGCCRAVGPGHDLWGE